MMEVNCYGSDMDIVLSPLKEADGSAKFTHKKSSVLACVRGPDQVSQQKEIIDRATVIVHYESKSGQSSCADRKMEKFIAEVCERLIITSMHPRTSILINLVELHDDGCLLACAINATVLALIDAGIPMRHMVAATTACLDINGTVSVNPSTDLIEDSTAMVTLVLESDTRQVLSLTSKGSLSTKQLTSCISALTKECVQMLEHFRHHLSN